MAAKDLTYQLNPLIEAQKNFDVMESRLFYLGLQDVNPHITENDKYYDKEFPDTVIPPTELVKIFGHGQYIQEVDKAADRLIGRYISVRYEDGFGKFTIFQHIRYKEGKGLYIKFNEDMRPFILDIYKSYKIYGFTKIEMKQIFVLSSAYAMRILELMLRNRGKAKKDVITREFKMDELREKLNVPSDAYVGKMCNFRKKVLDQPIQDINKNTRYRVNYMTVKKGRKVVGFKFFCDCSDARDDDFTDTIDVEPVALPTAEDVPALEAAEDKKAILKDQMMNGERFTLVQFNSIIKKWGVDVVAKNFALGVQEADARNLVGRARKRYIKSYVENDYAGDRDQAQEVRDREAALDAEKKRKQDEMSEAFAAQGISLTGKPAKPKKKDRELTEDELENLLSIVAYELKHDGLSNAVIKMIEACGFRDDREFILKYADRLRKY